MSEHPDLESRSAPGDHDALRLWLRLLTCSTLIEAEIRTRLRNEFDTTLPRFDLMAQLHRAPRGMKMGDLSRHMMVTNGNVTGITDQLEKEAMVRRLKDESDRRSSRIMLTPKGRKTFARMARAHEQWILELLSPVVAERHGPLYESLGELKKHLNQKRAT